MNTETGKRSDGHVHFGDFDRLPELQKYVERRRLGTIGLLSLPTAGTGEKGDEIVNFNPEVLVASSILAAHGIHAPAFGSLDNRYRLRDLADDGERWDPARQVQEMREAGFQGVKLWEGKPELQTTLRVVLDDPLLCAAYRDAGTLGMPVLVHVADPPLFWTRAGGLWSYVDRDVPDFEELMRQAGAMCECAPNTRFIFPHLLFLAGSLQRLAGFLDQYENAWVDLAPGVYMYPALCAADVSGTPLSEKQYTAARDFFANYDARILFGTDAFFLSPELQLLPPHSLEANFERYDTLLRFLTHTVISENPFPPRPEIGHVIGLGLDTKTIRLITEENVKNLFPEPVIPNRESIQNYLSHWVPPLPGESDEIIRNRLQRVKKGVMLLSA